jgi:hypothetical protein
MSARRFPPPWSIDALAECFIVRDANGQGLAYVYFDEDSHRRSKPEAEHGRSAAHRRQYGQAAGPLSRQ